MHQLRHTSGALKFTIPCFGPRRMLFHDMHLHLLGFVGMARRESAEKGQNGPQICPNRPFQAAPESRSPHLLVKNPKTASCGGPYHGVALSSHAHMNIYNVYSVNMLVIKINQVSGKGAEISPFCPSLRICGPPPPGTPHSHVLSRMRVCTTQGYRMMAEKSALRGRARRGTARYRRRN